MKPCYCGRSIKIKQYEDCFRIKCSVCGEEVSGLVYDELMDYWEKFVEIKRNKLEILESFCKTKISKCTIDYAFDDLISYISQGDSKEDIVNMLIDKYDRR